MLKFSYVCVCARARARVCVVYDLLLKFEDKCDLKRKAKEGAK